MSASDFLATQLDADDIIIAGSDQFVDFIPAGHLPPNPSELLMKERLEQLMEQVGSRYDYVLIDNVPIGGIADAQAAVEE